MAVDVVTDVEIGRPRDAVAAYACDPDNATQWYENIKSVVWQSPRPLAVGRRVEFVAQFLGRPWPTPTRLSNWSPVSGS